MLQDMALSIAGASVGLRGEVQADPAGQWEMLNTSAVDELETLVLGYTGYRESADLPLRRLMTPGTVAKIIFTFGAPLRVAAHGYEEIALNRSFFVPFSTLPAEIEFRGEAMGIEASLSPLGARILLGQELDQGFDPAIELDTLMGPEILHLTERLAETPTWDERFDLVDGFLLRRLAASEPPSPMVEWAWQRLLASGGRGSISSLAQSIGCSHEYLSRRFRREVGLAPKSAAAVIRFNRAESLLHAHRGRVGLGELAVVCGYTDQSHMTRDFRRFTGITPAAHRDQIRTRQSELGDLA